VAEKGRRVTSKHVKTLEKAGVKSINTPLEYFDGQIQNPTMNHGKE
jgi:hypothetical protein